MTSSSLAGIKLSPQELRAKGKAAHSSIPAARECGQRGAGLPFRSWEVRELIICWRKEKAGRRILGDIFGWGIQGKGVIALGRSQV
jgi:hypothetical protein